MSSSSYLAGDGARAAAGRDPHPAHLGGTAAPGTWRRLGGGGIAFDAFGGALNRVPAAATAFVHRDSLFLAQYTTEWAPGTAAGLAGAQRAWLRGCYAAMRPYASGQCYQNYADPDLADWQQAYYGTNHARLAHVKGRYDPAQVFRFPQAITPGP